MQAVIEALPVKPKKNRAIKIRAQRCLSDLLLRFRMYDNLDVDGDCELSKAECAAAPQSQLVARGGGSLADCFDDITGGTRLLNFADFYAHAVLVDGEGVPLGPEPEPEPRPQKMQMHHQQMQQLPQMSKQLNSRQISVHSSACNVAIGNVESVLNHAEAIVTNGEAALDRFLNPAHSIDALISAMLLHRADAAVQERCTAALWSLSRLEKHRGLVVAAGGIDALVSAMRSHGADAAVQHNCAAALQSLTLCEQHEALVVAGGGIDALISAMRSHGGDAAVQERCTAALENLR
jgi:hypothetical protein